ncbi:MATE family efflux transporter [Hahella sp. CCB-MM4]|uniref:MATE family efflux transporter n=1 Tax=Hahella sp. (strain CCB-MM4) TaxID=1926491 RepID=UPI000B9C7509|nr:MATE family efflux transporter [Hahella sp. CCB-MM4]OZG73270.1 MATE family efflux transporter [Hahella sp. CCB-MM4]
MSLHRRLWALAWPLILSNITVPLLGLVDTAVLGHLDSPLYLGAVALGANLFTFIFWAFGFLRMGTTGLSAQAWGAGDDDRLYRTLIQACVIGLGIGLLLFANQWWILPVGLKLMQTSAELWPQAEVYAGIRIYSAPAILIQYAITGWLIGNQKTRAALFLAVSTNIVNIVLDLFLVMGLGMRADGVALATTVAEYYSAIVGLWLCCGNRYGYVMQIMTAPELWRLDAFIRLLKFNADLFLRTILLLFTFAFFVAQGAQLGTDILAANAVLLTFLMLTSNALDGFANGAEALCGEAVGKGRLDQFKDAVRISGIWSLITAGTVSICFWLFGDWIINLLTDIESVRERALTYIVWMIALPLVGVWSYLYDGIFVGATKAKEMRNTIVLSVFFVFFPCWWLTQSFQNHGLWFSMTTFLGARGLIQWCYYRHITRHQRWLKAN